MSSIIFSSGTTEPRFLTISSIDIWWLRNRTWCIGNNGTHCAWCSVGCKREGHFRSYFGVKRSSGLPEGLCPDPLAPQRGERHGVHHGSGQSAQWPLGGSGQSALRHRFWLPVCAPPAACCCPPSMTLSPAEGIFRYQAAPNQTGWGHMYASSLWSRSCDVLKHPPAAVPKPSHFFWA